MRSPERRVQDAAYQRAKYVRRKAWLRSLKGSVCHDCGGTFHHSQLEFDHRVPTDKKFSIMLRHTKTVHSLLEEIAKCDVVCSNCHARRTWNRTHPEEQF